MLVEISTIPPPRCLRKNPVNPLVAAAPFVFRKLVSRQIIGGPFATLSRRPVSFTTLASLLRITPINVRFGVNLPSILVLSVRLPMCPIKLWAIGSVILVLNNVTCILCKALPTPLLASRLALITPCRSDDKCLAKALNTNNL